MIKQNFHQNLRDKINTYIHLVYKVTKEFPREETYGVTSQLRRSALSVMLNYIEGYARFKTKVHKNFLEIAYGSLQESKYILEFSLEEEFMKKDKYIKLAHLADEIGVMLWGIITKL
ncbi:MAG: four helix bundle protein [Parcubacteria group bacterium]|nr:four helix bundle protein [Parcubacteria group bacterium]